MTQSDALLQARELFEQGNLLLEFDLASAQRRYHQAIIKYRFALGQYENTRENEAALQLEAAILHAISVLIAQAETIVAEETAFTRSDRQFRLCKSAGMIYTRESEFWFPKRESPLARDARALHHLNQALEIGSTNANDVSEVREQICGIHYNRFFNSGYRQDAERAERDLRWLLKSKPDEHQYLSQLSLCLSESFVYTHDPLFLIEALELGEEAFVLACDTEDPHTIVNGTQAISHALRERANAEGSVDDVEMQIALLRCSLNRMPQQLSSRCFLDLELAEALRIRFSATEREEDLEEALARASVCKDVQDNFILSRSGCALVGLIQSDKLRFEHNTDQHAFQEPRQNLFWVSDLFAEGTTHPLAHECWLGLARLLRYGWQQIDQPDAGAQAHATWAFHSGYRAYGQANKWCKSWGNEVIICRAAYELSRLHYHRNTGSYLVSDAQAAARLAERAVESLTRPSSIFGKVARACIDAKRLAKLAGSEAVVVKSLSHPPQISLAERVALAHQICHLSRTTGEEDEAHIITRLGIVARIDTRHHPTRLDVVSCYGDRLAARAYTLLTADSFAEAILYCSTGQRELLNGRFSFTLLKHLAWLYYWRYDKFKDPKDAERAWRRLSEIASSPGRQRYTLFEHLDALEKLYCLLRDFKKDFSAVQKTLDQAMRLVEDVFGPERRIKDQLGLVREFGLFSEKIACQALAAGLSAEQAFEYMQRFHTIKWNQLTRAADYSNEEVLANLKENQAALQDLRTGTESKRLAGELHDEFSLAQKQHQLLQDVQQSLSANQLDRAVHMRKRLSAYLDPIPFVAVLESPLLQNGKALIFHNGGFESIELEAASPQVTKLMHQGWMAARSAGQEGLGNPAMRQILSTMLQILWHFIAKPILDHLGFLGTGAAGPSLPRVYWLASGIISVLPIHAAGVYDAVDTDLVKSLAPSSAPDSRVSRHWLVELEAETKESGTVSNVHDRVISSYIPSVGALQYVHEQKGKKGVAPTGNDTALIVPMPYTAGLPRLDHATAEANVVEEICKRAYTVERPLPYTSNIQKALNECSVAHFITHGTLSPDDPLGAQICLLDYMRKKTSMTVGHIMNLRFEKCRIVFLNICDSALTSDFALRNQGLHLPGAFHMAGVPTAIGTWYPVVDLYGPQVAQEFYRYCWVQDRGVFDFDRAAIALHEAVSSLRQQGCHPIEWGVYGHFGV